MEKPASEALNLKVRNTSYGDVPLAVQNDITISDFKNTYLDALKEK